VLCSWHARAAVLSYVQLAVFCNLFLLQSNDDVMMQLRQLVLRLLSDDQLEVMLPLLLLLQPLQQAFYIAS